MLLVNQQLINRPTDSMRLLAQDTFRLGIFTSASPTTVQTVIPMLESAAAAASANLGRLIRHGDLILSRRHTIAAPDHHVQGGGNAWDTVKPLHRWFKYLHRVILVDDDAYKVGQPSILSGFSVASSAKSATKMRYGSAAC